jgi:hypothetical protein
MDEVAGMSHKKQDPWENIRIASPCKADWASMTGDERSRFCGACNKHVYNLSEMTRDEAAELIEKNEGKLCVRLFRRRDGKVLTQDCPKGLLAVRTKIAAGIGAMVATIAGWFGYQFYQSMKCQPMMGNIAPMTQTSYSEAGPAAVERVSPPEKVKMVFAKRNIKAGQKIRKRDIEERMVVPGAHWGSTASEVIGMKPYEGIEKGMPIIPTVFDSR